MCHGVRERTELGYFNNTNSVLLVELQYGKFVEYLLILISDILVVTYTFNK